MEDALGRWVRTQMELPPPPGPVLRRLCSGSCGPIWEFVTRHIRHPRTVKKIRGNLLWNPLYQHLETEEGAGPALGGAVRQLRQEVGGLGGALGGAQEAAMELEVALGAGLSRRWAELRRGAELRLLGAELERLGRRLGAGLEALHPPTGDRGAGPALGVAAGVEPEVLVSVRAVCNRRAAALVAGLEEEPIRTKELMETANQQWRREAEAVLSRHPPALVLWALQRLAEESSRLPRPREAAPELELDLDLDPELDPEALPTVRSLIQDLWGEVGALWGRVPPMAARLRPLEQQLLRLQQHLGGDPKTLRAARLALEVAGLSGTRKGLNRGVQELRGTRDPPKLALGPMRMRLRQRQQRTVRQGRRLRALSAATRGRWRRLRERQEQVRGEGQVGLGRAPPALAGEGERLWRLLGELGALGEAPPRPAPDPLLPVCRALGLPPYKGPQGALCRAAVLRRELRRGAGPEQGAWPALPRPPERIVGGADAELLPRLQLVAAQTQRRIEAWPRLQQLVSQWWEQPAQWALAPPPGTVPFSHWLQRWTRAARLLGWARPLALAPPTPPSEGRDQDQPRP